MVVLRKKRSTDHNPRNLYDLVSRMCGPSVAYACAEALKRGGDGRGGGKEGGGEDSGPVRSRWAQGRVLAVMSAGGLLEKPQIIAHTQHSLNYTVFDCKWVPCSARLLCLGNFPRGTGVIQLYELQGGRLILLREVRKTKALGCSSPGSLTGAARSP